jgi:hypothetical protein
MWSLLLFEFLFGLLLLLEFLLGLLPFNRLCRILFLRGYARSRFCRFDAFRSRLLGPYRLLLWPADLTGLFRLAGYLWSDPFRYPGFAGFFLQSRPCRFDAF